VGLSRPPPEAPEGRNKQRSALARRGRAGLELH
jgi:hypothetical protein